MMKKITIPQPCHENWNNMTPEEQGRHCKVCNKTVIDFTKSTKEDILNSVEKSEDYVCGRFTNDQINRQQFPIKKIAASILAASALTATETIAQSDHKVGTVAIIHDQIIVANEIVFKGRIKFASNDSSSIEGATVTVYSMGNKIAETISTEQGYTFTVDKKDIVNNRITIQVSTDFTELKIIDDIEITKEKMTLDILVQEEFFLMGDVQVDHEPSKAPPENCVKGKIKIDD